VGLFGGVWQEDKDICIHSCSVIPTYTPTRIEPDSLIKMEMEMQCNQTDVLYTTSHSHFTWHLQTLHVFNFLALCMKVLTQSRRERKLVRGNLSPVKHYRWAVKLSGLTPVNTASKQWDTTKYALSHKWHCILGFFCFFFLSVLFI